MQLQLKRFVGQEKIAFFSQVILDKQNCILPPFPPAKSVYSGSLMASRISRFARYSNWSHSWPENTDFLGEKRRKNAILLISYNFPKENSYCSRIILFNQMNFLCCTQHTYHLFLDLGLFIYVRLVYPIFISILGQRVGMKIITKRQKRVHFLLTP